MLSLDNIKLKKVVNSIEYSKLRKKHFLVKEISALKGTYLEEALRWLYNTMMDYTKSSQNDKKYEMAYINLV